MKLASVSPAGRVAASSDQVDVSAYVPAAQRMPVALVTGASSGLGRAIALQLANAGYRVFAASRNVDAWTRRGPTPLRIVPLAMDVTRDGSVDEALAHLLEANEYLDLVVNNAGYGVAGAIEETPMDAAHAQLETNFFGTARVCRAAAGIMRRQRGGCIVNISSIGGRLGLPYQGYYSASKFAVEGFTEALRYEMEPFGVRVCTLAPGNFKTEFGRHRHIFGLTPESAHAVRGRRVLEGMARDELTGADPQDAALAVYRLAQSRRPPLRRSVGPWFERLGLFLSTLMPRFLFDRGYAKVMRM